tara:strand:+ start:49 stop:423 length:375 start_codon:yes stop_codon:yes gene_type:complete
MIKRGYKFFNCKTLAVLSSDRRGLPELKTLAKSNGRHNQIPTNKAREIAQKPIYEMTNGTDCFDGEHLSEECYRNGTRAYLKLHPTTQYQSAKASASRLLKKPSVIQAVKQKLEKIEGVNKCCC